MSCWGKAYLYSPLKKASVLSTSRKGILTKLELSQVIGAAKRRGRVIIALQALSGIHPYVLGSADGTDGLLFNDFLNSEITSIGLRVNEYPAIFRIRASLNRQSTQGYACICEEGLIYINEYLGQRMHEGEVLSLTSPVISNRDQQSLQIHSRNQFLPSSYIEKEVHRAFISENIPWSHSILRNYFESNLVLARQNNKITNHELNSLLKQSTKMKKSSVQSYPSRPCERRRMCRAYNACKPYLSTVINSSSGHSLFNESNGWVYV
jgi:hypothetical protein